MSEELKERCCNCRKAKCIVVDVYDKNHNKLETKLLPSSYVPTVDCHICLEIQDDVSVFSIEDLRFLIGLLADKLRYGGETVTEMVKFAEMYKKVENELEKNRPNQ